MFRKRPKGEAEGAKEPKELARREEAAPPAAPQRLDASLEIIAGPGKGEVIRLSRIVTLIGRQEGCDIVLQDQTVSREHGQFEQSLGQWVYTNFSENGTYLNRKKVERAILADGDVLEMGSETRLKFALREAEAATAGLVVRRRPRRRSDEVEEEEEEEEQAQANVAATIGDSLRKRRGVVILLAIYFAFMLVVGIALWARKGDKKSQNPDTGEWTRAQIDASLDMHFGRPPDATAATAKLREGYAEYQRRLSPDLMCRYNALRAFTEASEYLGGSMIPWDYQKAAREVREELVTNLWSLYRDALLAEARGKKDRARRLYNEILGSVGSDNEFYKHCAARQSRP